ncbi:MAG: hypothetical protein LBV72_02315 [Tannerella sp.]|jgi:hypothetical protein|nr:hypothetical protein [Tannerella sp.]
MKKIVLLFLIISSYAYASFPEDLFGISLGMDQKAVEMIMNKNNLKKCKIDGNSRDKVCYSGGDLQVLGIRFDEVTISYNNNMVNGIIFKLFIPQEEGTQRRIFRNLYDEIKPFARSAKDENIRYNYLFKLKDKQEDKYIRLSIKEILQGDVGYNIILTSSYTDKRLSEY